MIPMPPFFIALSQSNPVLGDLPKNADLVAKAAQQASAKGAKLLLTPELSLTGYPPEDLLLRDAFIQAVDQQLALLTKTLAAYPDLRVIVGHPKRTDAGLQNVASVLYRGEIVASYAKQKLPNHEVFDEVRYFVPGTEPCIFEIDGTKVGLIICEDAWHASAAAQAKHHGAELLVIPNASPYHLEKQYLREDVAKARVLETGLPLIYSNAVGGQDELVFDGASFALSKNGELALAMPHFKEDLAFIEYKNSDLVKTDITAPSSIEAQVYDALVLGVKDYLGKNGFPGAIIGLSGGVDSALVLAIAVDALGADKVRAVMMPSRYTADISWIDAKQMADNLGVQYDEITIAPMVDAFDGALASEFKGLPVDATEENIQARVRGTLLMAMSNKSGRIVLTTGNKSEMAVGYCTLYGDMAGGFAVIKDIAKTLVYRLCHYRNSIAPVIPERILTRAPSAELRPDQKDQDSLPEYDVLDAILGLYMEQDESIESIIAKGYLADDVEKVTRLIKINEYKRRQAPIGVRITQRAFGRDWRYPITNKFRA
ncbi:NAD+ synthase (glutamine-hydrolysing) [Polynucleobacter victoriensis]|uniref:Glutamine-dependent NAD(+) synthetase n=2 Tax=Polynucleobacter victoriensis TaxID=2049319 RepID=A0A212U2U6_9BURK|nr:NAD+ synthase (glutamine-hydrolysing) [Polynucleobacter victoriensis]